MLLNEANGKLRNLKQNPAEFHRGLSFERATGVEPV